MPRAIITGATGALGLALMDELTAHGWELLVLTHADGRNSRLAGRAGVSVRTCPLDGLSALANDTGLDWDVWYHFGWAGTTGARRDDAALQAANVAWAVDAVHAAARFGCRRFVGAGTQAEYGRAEGVLRPDTPCFPETGYGMGKLAAGHLTRLAAQALGLTHAWVRIVSLYGPGDWADGVLPSSIRAMLAGEAPRLTAGEQRLDLLFSGDAARAFRLLAERGEGTYVLGSGTAEPLRRAVELARDCVDPGITPAFGALPYRPGQVMRLCADVSRLTADTGWEPLVPLEEGIRLTVDAMRASRKEGE